VYDDIPRLFSDTEIYHLKDFINSDRKIEMKTDGHFFINNKKYNDEFIELSKKNLVLTSSDFGRIVLHEWFYFFFPKYLEIYINTMNVIMIKDEFVPVTWRYYIAIMVSLN